MKKFVFIVLTGLLVSSLADAAGSQPKIFVRTAYNPFATFLFVPIALNTNIHLCFVDKCIQLRTGQVGGKSYVAFPNSYSGKTILSAYFNKKSGSNFLNRCNASKYLPITIQKGVFATTPIRFSCPKGVS